jgi:hypothetical protein
VGVDYRTSLNRLRRGWHSSGDAARDTSEAFRRIGRGKYWKLDPVLPTCLTYTDRIPCNEVEQQGNRFEGGSTLESGQSVSAPR